MLTQESFRLVCLALAIGLLIHQLIILVTSWKGNK